MSTSGISSSSKMRVKIKKRSRDGWCCQQKHVHTPYCLLPPNSGNASAAESSWQPVYGLLEFGSEVCVHPQPMVRMVLFRRQKWILGPSKSLRQGVRRHAPFCVSWVGLHIEDELDTQAFLIIQHAESYRLSIFQLLALALK